MTASAFPGLDLPETWGSFGNVPPTGWRSWFPETFVGEWCFFARCLVCGHGKKWQWAGSWITKARDDWHCDYCGTTIPPRSWMGRFRVSLFYTYVEWLPVDRLPEEYKKKTERALNAYVELRVLERMDEVFDESVKAAVEVELVSRGLK